MFLKHLITLHKRNVKLYDQNQDLKDCKITIQIKQNNRLAFYTFFSFVYLILWV
jgi:hypothetical protein